MNLEKIIVLLGFGIPIVVDDVHNYKISNSFVVSYLLFCTVMMVSDCREQIVSNFFCAVAFFLILVCIKFITHAFGAGDIKYITVNTFCFGYFVSVFALLVASIFAMAFMFFAKKTKQKIAFAPFILTGFFICSVLRWFIA